MTLPERTNEIHGIARLTGLSTARLRAWERRYDVARPRRMPNGYRISAAEQVARLRAFTRLIGTGVCIRDLATHPREELLARGEEQELGNSVHGALPDAPPAFDGDRLEALAAQQLSLRGLRGLAHAVAVAWTLLPARLALSCSSPAGSLPQHRPPSAGAVSSLTRPRSWNTGIAWSGTC